MNGVGGIDRDPDQPELNGVEELIRQKWFRRRPFGCLTGLDIVLSDQTSQLKKVNVVTAVSGLLQIRTEFFGQNARHDN